MGWNVGGCVRPTNNGAAVVAFGIDWFHLARPRWDFSLEARDDR